MGTGIPFLINQVFTFDFNSLENWNSTGIYYTKGKIKFWPILTSEGKSRGIGIPLGFVTEIENAQA